MAFKTTKHAINQSAFWKNNRSLDLHFRSIRGSELAHSGHAP